VLCADGSGDRRALCRNLLESSGFEVLEAADGVEAIRRATEERPDLVLLEAKLPELDGYEVAARLRGMREFDQVPIVAHGNGDRSLALSVGCDGFLDEPIDPPTVPDRLREFLAGKRERLGLVTEKRKLREYSQALVERLEHSIEELKEANVRLRAQAAARDEFMQNLSHELATPLTPLIGYLKLMRSGRLGAFTEQQQHVLESMSKAAERLGRNIDNLVDFAAMESGQYRVARTSFDASAMVAGCLDELYPKARGKRVRLDARRPEHLPMMADERKLRQALANVVDNAVHCSPHGGRVLVVVDGDDKLATFGVYDQGPGMPQEAMRSVLSPMPPLVSDERIPGSGLGLPVVRQIVEAHGGSLVIESPPRDQPEPGELFTGARVAFTVPGPAPDQATPEASA